MTGAAAQLSDVLTELTNLLQQADMDSTTEVVLQQALKDHFGCDVSEYEDAIQAHITAFVQEQAKAAHMATAQKSAGSAIKRAAEPAAPQPAGKVAKSEPACEVQVGAEALTGEDGVALTEDGMARCSVRDFKGKTYVNLRTYYMKDGKRLPGKRGIMLNTSEWQMLADNLATLQKALADSDTSAEVQLAPMRKACVSDFKKGQSAVVDVREWYEKDGDLKPGQKGLALDHASFNVLLKNAAAITSACSSTVRAPAQAAPTANVIAVKGEAVAAMPEAGAAVDTETSSTGECLYKLGDNKFASISEFKGKRLVGLREHYQKDGAGWAPGTKGISLAVDQFHALCSAAEQVTGALAAADTSFEHDLSSMRKVTISNFKKQVYVQVREYYEKNGALAPGAKGLALSATQWAALLAVLPTLQAQLSSS